MKAVVYSHARPIDADNALIDADLPDPAPHHHDLLVEVRAVSVNPVDTKLRRNADPVGEMRVLGFDAAGVVRAIGSQVANFGVGDEVWYAGSIARPGANSELHLVDERVVGRKPRALSFAEAAAMPLTTITAWEMLFDRLAIPRAGAARGRLLIIGGAGGVGSIAIQLARALTGLQVIATASRPETRDWCSALGAHLVIDHSRGDMVAALHRHDIEHVDYIFGTNASERHWNTMVRAIAPQGRVGVIDELGSAEIGALKQKSASLHWEMMFTRPMFGTPDMIEQHRLLEAVSAMVDQGTLRTTMTEQYGRIDAVNLTRAHAMVETGRARGKIVLEGF